MESPLDGLSNEESRRYLGPISSLWRALAGDKSRTEIVGRAVGICERYRGLPEIPSGLTRALRWFSEGPEGTKIMAAAALEIRDNERAVLIPLVEKRVARRA